MMDTTQRIICITEECTSALVVLSFKFVAFKKIAPNQDIGFDLSAEYEAAKKMFGAK